MAWASKMVTEPRPRLGYAIRFTIKLLEKFVEDAEMAIGYVTVFCKTIYSLKLSVIEPSLGVAETERLLSRASVKITGGTISEEKIFTCRPQLDKMGIILLPFLS